MHDIYDSSLSHTKNTGLKTHKEASYNAIEVGEGGGGQKVIKLQYLTPYFNRKWYINYC